MNEQNRNMVSTGLIVGGLVLWLLSILGCAYFWLDDDSMVANARLGVGTIFLWLISWILLGLGLILKWAWARHNLQ